MENYIFVSGATMYMFLGLMVFIMIAAILLGVSYFKELNNNYKLKTKNRGLKRKNLELENQTYKMNFKVPEVEESENV